jgi:hypothetical protein
MFLVNLNCVFWYLLARFVRTLAVDDMNSCHAYLVCGVGTVMAGAYCCFCLNSSLLCPLLSTDMCRNILAPQIHWLSQHLSSKFYSSLVKRTVSVFSQFTPRSYAAHGRSWGEQMFVCSFLSRKLEARQRTGAQPKVHCFYQQAGCFASLAPCDGLTAVVPRVIINGFQIYTDTCCYANIMLSIARCIRPISIRDLLGFSSFSTFVWLA